MSEFKYACPVCGQHIKCDTSQAGTTMECPTCFQKIIVPQAPAMSDPKFIITGTKVGNGRPLPSAPADLGVPLPPAKGPPAAAIVVVILLCAAAAAAFAFRGKIFKSAGNQTNLTTPVAGENQAPTQAPAKPVVVAPPANDTNWTLDLGAAVIPDATAAGRIHGRDFLCERAILEGGTLTMRTPAHGATELGLSIYLYANQTADLAGQSVNIASGFTNAPRVRLRWKDDQQQSVTKDFKQGYALRVEFDQPAGSRLPGKIYLCTPDEMRSYVTGTFNAEIRKPKPPKQN